MKFIDLILDTGEMVRVEVPKKWADDACDLIENTMKRRDWFCAASIDGMHFTFMGLYIERVNMARVVGMNG